MAQSAWKHLACYDLFTYELQNQSPSRKKHGHVQGDTTLEEKKKEQVCCCTANDVSKEQNLAVHGSSDATGSHKALYSVR